DVGESRCGDAEEPTGPASDLEASRSGPASRHSPVEGFEICRSSLLRAQSVSNVPFHRARRHAGCDLPVESQQRLEGELLPGLREDGHLPVLVFERNVRVRLEPEVWDPEHDRVIARAARAPISERPHGKGTVTLRAAKLRAAAYRGSIHVNRSSTR